MLLPADATTVTFPVASPTCFETRPASSLGIFKQYWPLAMLLSYLTNWSCFLKRLHQLPGPNNTLWSLKEGARSQDITISTIYNHGVVQGSSPQLSVGRKRTSTVDVFSNWAQLNQVFLFHLQYPIGSQQKPPRFPFTQGEHSSLQPGAQHKAHCTASVHCQGWYSDSRSIRPSVPQHTLHFTHSFISFLRQWAFSASQVDDTCNCSSLSSM